ncbi:alpha-D-ribose 1-methylphosphonate 5-triphosphate diphosphatase [Yersinia kristensenii]|uniref:alpha-D-ribose 1-methylphosphonate 5-triphosphate diphosphatase n=1 Tax=Yersinia kristensenii TaxID=28152 RepID=UPI0003103497|nr:alpha-D-ribose 1-methylphosphonate 5-triphosphate diphosphatase [Yersinia kristensenii]PEH53885.1 alpha-D-ribose 1-methylphosphonate 5-triphosphate diphosphatase [Yersinia kristensenii]
MILNNVNLILEDQVVSGSLEIHHGKIRSFSDRPTQLSAALDGQNSWLLPGLIELHTDNLDKFFTPRPNVDWPAHSAMSSHDALMVASGITTVLDAVAVGDVRDGGHRLDNLQKMINAVVESQRAGLNRAEHRIHLRCELPHDSTLPLFEELMMQPELSLVSLMDHSPGQRQFASRAKYREYYQGKYHLNDMQMAEFEEEQISLSARWSRQNRQAIAAHCRERGIALASHDDATAEHVAESQALGSVIAEFPTTEVAAKASHQHGLQVLMGAPNIVRGGSHSGNVAAHQLATLGVLDILSSDYYPASLLDAAFRIAQDSTNSFTLPQAVNLVTRNPARALGLEDRGVIAEGKRADLILARTYDGPQGQHVYVQNVWRQGIPVF